MIKKQTKKYFLFIFLTIVLILFLIACDNENETIKLNGNFEETIEVNNEYKDAGILCSTKYNIVTEGEVISNKLGKYQIKYKIFSDGELKKELYRYVNVCDTTAPVYIESENMIYYAGYTYVIDDFISYSDNYDDKANISSDFISNTFTTPGNHLITIKLTDSSHNETIFTKNINVILDLGKKVRDVYKNQLNKISTSSTEYGTTTHIKIDSTTSFSFWDTGSIHFIKQVETSLGSYASIQISATKYGKFNNANVSFHISGDSSQYSVGFASFDATKKYSTLTLSSFSSTINNLNLDETDMLNECNNNLLSVLNEFQNYMATILQIELK